MMKPKMAHPIISPVLIELNDKYPQPTNMNRDIAVLFTVPSIVMVLPDKVLDLKVLFDKTGFPDLSDKCLFICIFFSKLWKPYKIS